MTTISTHPHAAFDRFPQLLEDLADEFGRDGVLSTADRIINAEWADFHWDGRIAEMNLGAYEAFDDDHDDLQRVAILGYFRARYYVAICIVDGERGVHWMFEKRTFDTFAAAETAFLARGR